MELRIPAILRIQFRLESKTNMKLNVRLCRSHIVYTGHTPYALDMNGLEHVNINGFDVQ